MGNFSRATILDISELNMFIQGLTRFINQCDDDPEQKFNLIYKYIYRLFAITTDLTALSVIVNLLCTRCLPS
jgi:hypothetical protein